ncbi:MAG: hypothetical protein WAL59_16325 [Roseiarcus sp.]
MKGAAELGAFRTGLAANNIDVNSGSSVDLEASQRQKGELNDETTLFNSQLQAYGYRVNATSDTAQAQLDEATAENAPVGAGLSAAGGLQATTSSRAGSAAPWRRQLAEYSGGRIFFRLVVMADNDIVR